MIKTSPTATGPMNKSEAHAITERIRSAVDGLWSLLLEAHERKAWKALGYATWEAYIKDQFGMGRSRAYQLLDQGRAIAAIKEATGDLSTSVDISEADAREIKPVLPEVTAEIEQRVEAGEAPAKAADEAVKSAREKIKQEREQKKEEAERQREETAAQFSPEVKAQQAAKKEAIQARAANEDSQDALTAELEEARETIAALEKDLARLKAENQKFSEMKALFDKGGFEAVIAAKDEVIDVQKTRIERESGDKASWKRTADMWRKRAEEAGWSNDIVIDLETGEVVNG